MGLFDYWRSLVSTLWRSLGFEGKSGSLLLLGLDNAGKTTLLHRLRTGTLRNYPPTDRPQLTEHFSAAGITFRAWDLGGHEAVRHLWTDYAPEVDGVLFLVDSSDHDRIDEAGYELDHLLGEKILPATIPVAICVNKCDLEAALDTPSICEKMQYNDLLDLRLKHHQEQQTAAAESNGNTSSNRTSDARLQVFRISVLRGEGYQEALKWIGTFL
uniref:Uncharacterized protein n=1 Tax=Grammatophora oceanica TaxID=210454 RepID=A0A7S1UTX9_9STRA|mmetsp:Transcript_19976/g.29602  ORF Transcript_19976/g.29602 Transcript_19976/m.29602 type:complete len:214 (+) Transcript_19976:228-869(+)